MKIIRASASGLLIILVSVPLVSAITGDRESGITKSPVSAFSYTAKSNETASNDSTTVVFTFTTPSSGNSTSFTPDAVTKEVRDHVYYTSRLLSGWPANRHWQPLTADNIILASRLSGQFSSILVIRLAFVFPFYGHEVRQVTIVTAGFLYMSSFLHPFLAQTQYIAPLMAAFDFSISKHSNVYYRDNVLWSSGGAMSTYTAVSTVPLKWNKSRWLYNSKIGLADAFYMDRNFSFGFGGTVQHRTIAQYHSLQLPVLMARSHSAIIINPLPTCISQKSCRSCLGLVSNFSCSWCEKLSRCSDGVDRMHQTWHEHRCHLVQATQCPGEAEPSMTTGVMNEKGDITVNVSGDVAGNVTDGVTLDETDNGTWSGGNATLLAHRGGRRPRVSSTALRICLIALAVSLASMLLLASSWGVYAHLCPNSRLGLFCIEYRPSQLRRYVSRVRFWKSRGTDHYDDFSVSVNANDTFT